MKAMILAAGLGTRLRPLTEKTPKALVKIRDRSILEIIILRLRNHGFRDIIINVHHHHGKIVDFLKENNRFGINIQVSDEQDQILDTGGGIKKASWFLQGREPFLVHNVDVISNINLKDMYDFHIRRRPLATLAVKDKGSTRSLLFDRSFKLCGWENTATGQSRILHEIPENDMIHIGFTGIHLIEPTIFKHMDDGKVFSIISTYMSLAEKYPIYGYPTDDNLWMDIGSFEQLEAAQRLDPDTYLN